MTKIYFQQGILLLQADPTGLCQQTIRSFDSTNNALVNDTLTQLESGSLDIGKLYGPTEEAIFQLLSSYYTPISAAGGLIENASGDYLFIFRRGKWDLPKGKMDEGESALDTAVREIEEETGVNGLELITPLPDSFHVYEAFDKKWLKTTHWFHFKTSFKGKLIPQTEEQITEIKWVTKNELHVVKNNTYPAISDLISQFFT